MIRINWIILIVILSCGSCQRASTGADCIDQSKINPDAICIEVYQPVCGCDNKTYGNECVARNQGVTSWKEGECPGR